MRNTNKTDFLACIDKNGENNLTSPDASVKIVDGAAVVQMLKPIDVKTFGDAEKFSVYVLSCLNQQFTTRVDIIFDRYLPKSLKSETRLQRGKGVRISAKEDTPFWKNWNEFLRDDTNKTELFQLLAKTIPTNRANDNMIVATYNENVLVNRSQEINVEFVSPCNQEEADTRIFLHAKHASMNGHNKVLVQTVNTDVVVLALSLFKKLQVDELWIEFGVGIYKRWLPIYEYYLSLGESRCEALPNWFAFTGCNTVSSFCGRGKKIAWNTWNVYPDITETFIR